MSKVVVIVGRISGTRDGVEWPAPGGELVVPDEEAAQLEAAGLARVVEKKASKPVVEKAVAPKAETRKRGD